ncbi:MAG TPA: adenylyltransferase/cytidyltransferase family protein [Planctomycetota bacterium]|nr:adenylyltransferase/cytidyltransferase family protein [Planctomycetota bacterium]
MKTVFVSGCFEIIHGGHVEFFRQARGLGDRLVVCIASDDVIRLYKQRAPAIPLGHRVQVVAAIRHVDGVMVDAGEQPGCAAYWNFVPAFEQVQPDVLAVTEDDGHIGEKAAFAKARGARLVVLPKTGPCTEQGVSTTSIRRRIAGDGAVPLRVDFAGGWLDVPGLAPEGTGGYVVNCAISPCVSADDWHGYQPGGGLGGSAAKAILEGRDPFVSEEQAGAGWQDPAVITETGLCVWAGCRPKPKLVYRVDCDWLRGLMAIRWTGQPHSTPDLAGRPRNYEAIKQASVHAHWAVNNRDVVDLAAGILGSYAAQLAEGMADLDKFGQIAMKYLGSGWGGYALYLFDHPDIRSEFIQSVDGAIAIEPFDRWAATE